MSAAPAEQAERLTVNKRELAARILKCSLPTLDRLLEDYRDFPVIARGSNGVEWEFDPEAVQEFLRQQRAAEERAEEQRKDLFKQFSLPIDDIAADDAVNLTPAQRNQLARARLVEQKLARESGFLISTAELRPKLMVAFERLAKQLDALPDQIAREFGLPEEVTRRMRASMNDSRRALVQDVQQALRAQTLSDAAE